MAITRSQQFKQMLAQGGRIGLQGGGKDMGGVAASSGGNQNRGGDAGGGIRVEEYSACVVLSPRVARRGQRCTPR